MKTAIAGAIATVAIAAHVTLTSACTASDGNKIVEWMKSCDSITNSTQAKCNDRNCHTALHRLIEDDTAQCYVELGLGPANVLAKYKPIDSVIAKVLIQILRSPRQARRRIQHQFLSQALRLARLQHLALHQVQHQHQLQVRHQPRLQVLLQGRLQLRVLRPTQSLVLLQARRHLHLRLIRRPRHRCQMAMATSPRLLRRHRPHRLRK